MSKKRLQLRFGLPRTLFFPAYWLDNRRERRTARLSWNTSPPSLCSNSNRRYAYDKQQRCRNRDSVYSHLGWHSSPIGTHSFFNLLRKNKRCKFGCTDHCLALDPRLHPRAGSIRHLVPDGVSSPYIPLQHLHKHFCNLFNKFVLPTRLLDRPPF